MTTAKNDDNDTAFDFPCQFPIKVMGENSDYFETLILDIIQRHNPEFEPQHNMKKRHSNNQRYVSLTFTITATSKAQLDAIYIDITQCPEVKMAL